MLNARTCQGMRFKAQLLHPAIIYPVHSVAVTMAPVSETSSFGIVKLQAHVTDADQASSTATAVVYVENQESSFQFHSSGSLQDISVSSITGLVDSSSTSSDVITLTEEVYENCLESINGNEKGFADEEEESMQDALDSLDTTGIPGVGSSEQLWVQVTPACLPAVILSALED